MRVLFRESFVRDLRRIEHRDIQRRIQEVVESVEQAASLQDVPNLRRLHAKGQYYRIRVGDYRLGLTLDGDEITFVRALHRREIYRYFP